MSVRGLLFVCAFCLLASLARVGHATESAPRYVALVIGSGSYSGAQALPNVLPETRAIAKRLQRLGYRVIYLPDPRRDDILRALAVLRIMAQESFQVVIYLSGHGYMQGGEAFYLPVDSIKDRSKRALPIMLFSRAVSDRPRQKIIFFDACRTDFALPPTAATPPKLSWQAGLALVYASAPGSEAYDGAYDGGQSQSPFARAFLHHVSARSPPLPELMRQIRRDVARFTQGAQVPWFQSAMLNEVFLQPR